MIDGSYAKAGLLHALSQLRGNPRARHPQIKVAVRPAISSGCWFMSRSSATVCCLQQKVQSLSGQLSDLMPVELLGAEEDLPACPASRELPPLQNSGWRGSMGRVRSTGSCAIRNWRRIADHLRMDDDYRPRPDVEGAARRRPIR